MNLNNQDSVIENAIELGGTTFVEDTVKNCVGTSQKSVEDNSGEPGFDANIDTDESHFDMDVDVDIGGSDKDNRVVDDIKRRPDFDGNGPCELEGIVPEEKDGSSVPVNEQRRATLRSQQQSKHERLSRRQSLAASGTSCKAGLRKSTRKRTRPLEYWKGERMVYGRVHDNKSNPSGCEAIVTNKYTKISDDGPELCLEVSEEKDGSSVPVNEQRRAKLLSQEQSKHERLSRRQSLAASGTSCNAGLRKSTRIRTRPLEYWKGERMVYGRVHDNLTICPSYLLYISDSPPLSRYSLSKRAIGFQVQDTVSTVWIIKHSICNCNDPIARAELYQLSNILRAKWNMHEGINLLVFSLAQLDHPGFELETSPVN
ncbi:hypothetical protein TanjilG_02865 [Lupinus angustifolius]|uniref:Uncharacterized protein n=1 Tax=Lupinus angustifolius TaxID=3871 RepID=A0A4P1RLI0_LUPAN|nr:hypothetical protein TanjilG_02865 [Lupinus angustifolius]